MLKGLSLDGTLEKKKIWDLSMKLSTLLASREPSIVRNRYFPTVKKSFKFGHFPGRVVDHRGIRTGSGSEAVKNV
jgi:hypothetical protein